jgi:hypothetical protein
MDAETTETQKDAGLRVVIRGDPYHCRTTESMGSVPSYDPVNERRVPCLSYSAHVTVSCLRLGIPVLSTARHL